MDQIDLRQLVWANDRYLARISSLRRALARHWLDVAGYADSEGQTTEDAVRPWPGKYRDYVIRSLNSNKLFDRFIIEQLAGDDWPALAMAIGRRSKLNC